ncbi:MAG: hypothetical protein UR85_C0004G0040 [Candidatus Nomurabacteria bacterium GW2011_GWF2_35_66]|uniref:Uncharacterized protein n=1 Tax=Candidatus Nomurabacteria bacterium GW2011_GWE1_35_16 TaxID=1618761 RepID=A0A0G0DUW2_9BACT|nr:MAG: hypothetical protein UR55_C0002G0039 [Candidatus Nomurabacteria bacterium GW2011_GWF1_34_20]KKP63618.1 MAG: hypothetical protein UR57_C0002G0039 [Candidatus Nomurabacteria bacterium GW2011_GWE2_34_25]KKP66820.1 MAG: hypothetical protein UR64_C0002G0036 [Candidatus Nomurabacteria bacterium GW2011_GWE1_35_16]KKP83446.1 MAG: hypothetical protein UR85_C0004G0040 [Candidatus Nomurabacteria bacterium GW2011_GWF2_35_66]HAE36622.1 hypothetical protein [Candidatus Nomurabacteria bacterium]
MQPTTVVQTINQKPIFDPTYLNMEYVFDKIANSINPIISAITDVNTWQTIGIISVLISILALFVIIFSLVRMYEIQVFDREEIEHEINHALAKDKEMERLLNPKWKYILTLIESPNESDWRIAVMESDSLLEESFKERGLIGSTMSDLLEEAKLNGYPGIQGAWDAHLIRNKIAHEGLDYPFTQIEARRVVKLYQNVFEGLGVI